MCEKNLEGKVLSPPSDGDIDESYPKDWEKVKPKKTKRRSKNIKKRICKSCCRDIIPLENHDVMRFTNTYDQLLAKDYCKDHERVYSDHKCKPHWCGDCGFLIKYDVTIDKSHWDR